MKSRSKALAAATVVLVTASTLGFAPAAVATTSTSVPSIAGAVKCIKVADAEVKKFKRKKCPKGWVKSKQAAWVKKRIDFLETARELEPILESADDSAIYSAGVATCQTLDAGGNFDEIVEAIVEAEVDASVGAAIMSASILYLCPGHQAFLEEWLAT